MKLRLIDVTTDTDNAPEALFTDPSFAIQTARLLVQAGRNIQVWLPHGSSLGAIVVAGRKLEDFLAAERDVPAAIKRAKAARRQKIQRDKAITTFWRKYPHAAVKAACDDVPLQHAVYLNGDFAAADARLAELGIRPLQAPAIAA